jgi:hypothetical protein
MPQRLGHVTIALTGRDVTLTWEARQALMLRMRDIGSKFGIRATFGSAGTTHAVGLSLGQKTALLKALETWSLDGGGHDAMPEGLHHLRTALLEDLTEPEGPR